MSSSQEQGTSASAQSEESGLEAPHEEEDDRFWGLDDIPGMLFLFYLVVIWLQNISWIKTFLCCS